MIKIYLPVLVAFVVLFPGTVLSQSVVHGERPSIDLSKIPADAFEKGKINIKFKSLAASFLQKQVSRDHGIVRFGNKNIDELNHRFEVKETKRVFENIFTDKKFDSRHRAAGLQLWYEVDVAANVNIIDAVKAYAALDMIEVAEPCYKKILYDQFNWSPADPQYSPNRGSDAFR